MIKVTYLDHSGFLVELEDAYFLFDYYKGRLPQIDLEKKMFWRLCSSTCTSSFKY